MERKLPLGRMEDNKCGTPAADPKAADPPRGTHRWTRRHPGQSCQRCWNSRMCGSVRTPRYPGPAAILGRPRLPRQHGNRQAPMYLLGRGRVAPGAVGWRWTGRPWASCTVGYGPAAHSMAVTPAKIDATKKAFEEERVNFMVLFLPYPKKRFISLPSAVPGRR